MKTMAPTLNVPHHVFLQKMMVEHVLSANAARQLYRDVAQAEDAAFDQFLNDINDNIGFLSMEIRVQTYQGDGKKYYGFVNKVADDQAKLGTKFQLGQIAHFKAILEAIVQDSKGSGEISSMDAINLRPDTQGNAQAAESSQAAAARNLSATDKERNIEELVADGWLEKQGDGRLALGPRTFMELRTYIQSLDVPTCNACKEPAVKGQSCEAPDCNTRLHNHCAKSWFNRPGEPRKCPDCGADWPAGPQEEAAAEEPVEDLGASTQRAKKAKRERRSKT